MNLDERISRAEEAVQRFSDGQQSLDVKSTKQVYVKSAHPTSRFFYVQNGWLENLYCVKYVCIVDTPTAREVACFPHIISRELEWRMRLTARETMNAILELQPEEILRSDRKVILCRVYRASPGYEWEQPYRDVIGQPYQHVIGSDLSVVGITTKYFPIKEKDEKSSSYRNHTRREIRTIFANFEPMPEKSDITLLLIDTSATGGAVAEAIKQSVNAADVRNSKIKTACVGGFTSRQGLESVAKTAQKYGIQIVAFPLVGITALDTNNYDMPLMGHDEPSWRERRELVKVGGIMDWQTVVDCTDKYVWGSDPPGDFSHRQRELFDGVKREKTDLRTHLVNSRTFIQSLLTIPECPEWQKELAYRELGNIDNTLEDLTVNPWRYY